MLLTCKHIPIKIAKQRVAKSLLQLFCLTKLNNIWPFQININHIHIAILGQYMMLC